MLISKQGELSNTLGGYGCEITRHSACRSPDRCTPRKRRHRSAGDRNLRRVLRQPRVEVHELRIQLTRPPGVARLVELLGEHLLVLELVSEILGAGEAELPVIVERDVVV